MSSWRTCTSASARRATSVDGDPIPFVAERIAQEARLLCFDELQVTDIADAMILGRLFKQLFERGVVVVSTSNSAPRALYKDGLNRKLFLPFIDVLEAHMDVVELVSAKDYRLDKLAGLPLYFTPADARATAELDRHWDRLTGRHPGREESVHVKGRSVRVPLASMGIARFDFRDLCELPLGSLDYLHLAHAYHTVVVDRIPVLTRERRDTARRFMNLIDTLYDNGVCFIASAEAEPARSIPGRQRDGRLPAHGVAADGDAQRGLSHEPPRRGAGPKHVLACRFTGRLPRAGSRGATAPRRSLCARCSGRRDSRRGPWSAA